MEGADPVCSSVVICVVWNLKAIARYPCGVPHSIRRPHLTLISMSDAMYALSPREVGCLRLSR